jgi:hypothetical protein
MIVERTIAINQYVRLFFEPLKADGVTIGSIDHTDHAMVWTVNGVNIPLGVMTEIGIARIQQGGSTCDVHALTQGGGTQTFTVSARGDADMDDAEVRDVIWTFELHLTVLPDEAVEGAGRVSEPLTL